MFMSRLKQSLAWWCYAHNEVTPQHLVRAAAEIGYRAIDLVDEAYWPLVKDHGLEIASIVGHASIAQGCNRREQHARIERELRAAIVQAERWRIPNLICFSGNRDGLDDATGAAITAEGLQRVAPLAEQAGITLVLELLNSKVDHPDYQADHIQWGIQVCDLVGSPAVKLLYDIYHMQVMEGDIVATIARSSSYFAHYHTAGNPGRHDLDEEQELFYPAIVRAILQTGYNGYLAHEFLPKGETIPALRTAFEQCNLDAPIPD
jgi:hydroxypyruvate isomerase